MIGRAAMRNPWCLRHLVAADRAYSAAAGSNSSVTAAAAAGTSAARAGAGNAEWTAVAASDATSDATGEWPEPAEVERAAQQNAAWSADRPAAARYRRFREENFERLRRESAQASLMEPPLGPSGPSAPSDWYAEWSRASTRRRHLERLEDGLAMGAGVS